MKVAPLSDENFHSFGDGVGTPGTILTFFPWPDARPGVRGVGEIEATAFAIPTDSPGFTDDETVDELGAKLRLPPWLERARPQIEEVLPKIVLPTKATL